MSNYNTIYDDVFRTIVEKMPTLMLPVINEVFGTNYTGKEKVQVLHNEHHNEGTIITDSCLLIGRHIYHMECQSGEDYDMAIRMIEYDFYIALENAQRVGREYTMELPRSCTLYLRHNANTPERLKVKVVIPDYDTPAKTRTFEYETPIVKVQEYSKEEIFKKHLLAFLPYYIMRYEKELPAINEDKEKLEMLLDEYRAIQKQLEQEMRASKSEGAYADLVKLIIRISDYLSEKEDKVKKGVSDVMGGHVLELESERLKREGREESRCEDIARMLRNGKTAEEIADFCGYDLEAVRKVERSLEKENG